jgi:nitroreductase
VDVDQVLTTTRAVRKRLDLDRPVDPALVREALELATQAPSAGSEEPWRFVVITDPAVRDTVGHIYGDAYRQSTATRPAVEGEDPHAATIRRVRSSSAHLAEVMPRVPVQVLFCLDAPHPPGEPLHKAARWWASIYPAAWSFQLALRSRGLGSCLTTVGMSRAPDIARATGIPDTWTQCALIAVAHTIGQDFKPAHRSPLDAVTRWI